VRGSYSNSLKVRLLLDNSLLYSKHLNRFIFLPRILYLFDMLQIPKRFVYVIGKSK